MNKIHHHIASSLVFMFSCQTLSTSAEMTIAASAEATNPLQAGDMAADFTAYNFDGSEYRFDSDNLQRTTLLITFRGGWCPYCNTQLQELRNVLPEIKASGVDVLFLSGDRPEILYSNLKQETQGFVDDLDYTILSDADMNMGIAFGLAFRVPDDIISKYQSRNWDLEQSSMQRQKVLSVPAVYVIRKDGEIAFSYTNPDFRVRLPAEDVKAAVDKVLAEEPAYELVPMNLMM